MLRLKTLLFSLMLTLSMPLLAQAAELDSLLAVHGDDHVLGDPMAPVTVVEYASMSCSHCAHFHLDVLPSVQKNFIDRGYVKLVFRPLPWDNLALAVSKIAECAPNGSYFPFVEAYFETQKQWIHSGDPLSEMRRIARLGGMGSDAVDTCLKDTALHTKLVNARTLATDTIKVGATPTFFINGEKVEGARDYLEFHKLLVKALSDAGVTYDNTDHDNGGGVTK